MNHTATQPSEMEVEIGDIVYERGGTSPLSVRDIRLRVENRKEAYVAPPGSKNGFWIVISHLKIDFFLGSVRRAGRNHLV